MPEVLLPSNFQVGDDVNNSMSVAAAGGSVASRHSTLDDRDRADLYIGLQFDGYRDYANLTAAIPGITLMFYQLPTFDVSSRVIAYRPQSFSDIDIKVRLLLFCLLEL